MKLYIPAQQVQRLGRYKWTSGPDGMPQLPRL